MWEHFCSPADASSRFATCLTKAKPNDIRGNPHLVHFYQVRSGYFPSLTMDNALYLNHNSEAGSKVE